MKSFARVTLVLMVAMLVAAACGKSNKIGGGIDLEEVGNAKATCRLGECKSPTPSPAATGRLGVGAPSPTPPAPTKAPEDDKIYNIFLVEESPFYAYGPNKELGQDITMPVGFTLIVKNDDKCDCRKIRSYTAEGAFDSGPMKFGDTWKQRFPQPGTWKITDRSAGFIEGKLTVQ